MITSTLRNTSGTPCAGTLTVSTLTTGVDSAAFLNSGYLDPVIYSTCMEGLVVLTGDYPLVTNVREGIDYANGSLIGNMTEPAPADVKQGTQYGANGTEFTGTYAGGGKKNFGFNF